MAWCLSQYLWLCFVSLVKFNDCSKFHVNIITGSGLFHHRSFYKILNRNQEIEDTPVWVLPNIWGLGQVRNTKFDTNVSNKMLLNNSKCQDYSFYHFWVIKGNSTMRGGSEVKIPPCPTKIRVKIKDVFSHSFFTLTLY